MGRPTGLSRRDAAIDLSLRFPPVSRKTVIGDVLGIADPADRDAGTIACIVAGTLRGASIFRVHNVRAAMQALRVIYPIMDSGQ